MNTFNKNLFLLPALLAVLSLLPAGRVTAQTFTTLYYFTATHTNSFGVYTNGDGANPQAGLMILSGNTLYGTAYQGGSSGRGTVFAVNTDGTGFTNLHSLGGSDGAQPRAGLLLSGSTLYATTAGTVFAVNTDGTGFTNLHSFAATSINSSGVYTNSDGAYPRGELILSGNTLYGTAESGGSSGIGTVFAVNTDGTGFTNLHSFTYSDGSHPQAGLILSGNTLYGTAEFGGSSSGNGTVFAVNTDGTGFTNLHSFTGGSDGAWPQAGLILSGNTLYGTAYFGGSSGNGTVFAVNTDGTGFTNLYSFTETSPDPTDPFGSTYINSDGAFPQGLILCGNTLCGTTAGGGSFGGGTVFAVKTNGTGFTNLFDKSGAGGNRCAGYILSGNTLYGNTLYGTAGSCGVWGNGTVFSFSFPRPQLTLTPSGTNVLLSWPANVAGFDYTGYTLQSTTNLVSPAVWSTNSPAPVVLAGQNTVTNPLTGAQKFYRLVQ